MDMHIAHDAPLTGIDIGSLPPAEGEAILRRQLAAAYRLVDYFGWTELIYGHLTARASNGPLSLRVPAGYQSGVEVTSSNHSPWSCRASACSGGNRDWDDRTRSLRLGADPVVVRLSTVNGPVTVSER